METYKKSRLWIKLVKYTKMFFIFITGATIVLGASTADFVDILVAHSQGTMDFQTIDGNLHEGQYGVTDTGQTFVVVNGEVTDFEDQTLYVSVDGLKEVKFKGTKYQDVYKDGVIKEIPKATYEDSTREKKRTVVKIPIVSAAITEAATSSADSAGYVNSLTISLTCTGTDRGAASNVALRTLGDISGVTYAGDAMTSEVESLNNNVAGVEAWSRIAVASGASDIVYSLAEYRLLSVYNSCFNGTDQSDLVEATTTGATGWGTSDTQAVTTVTNNAWVMSGINLQGAFALAPDSGETELNDSDHTDGNLGQFGVSYIARVSAGSETMGWSWSTGDNFAQILYVIKPSVAAGGGAAPIEQDIIWFE